ncbi:Hypothetical predicted protein, partial [Pelobates cultripes]
KCPRQWIKAFHAPQPSITSVLPPSLSLEELLYYSTERPAQVQSTHSMGCRSPETTSGWSK